MQLAVVAASDDLSVLFSPAELAELLQFERAATVLQMRNREQQQQKGADGEEQQRGEEVDVERGRRQQQQQARAGGGDAQQGILAEDGPL